MLTICYGLLFLLRCCVILLRIKVRRWLSRLIACVPLNAKRFVCFRLYSRNCRSKCLIKYMRFYLGVVPQRSRNRISFGPFELVVECMIKRICFLKPNVGTHTFPCFKGKRKYKLPLRFISNCALKIHVYLPRFYLQFKSK